MKNELNRKIWESDDKINSTVRKNLLIISKDFIEYCKIKNLKLNDIILTGSIANFNWDSKSDIDVHVVFDLSNFGKHKKFLNEYLQTKKSAWNYKHTIELFGFQVELYPEDKSKEHISSGIYSLIRDAWIVKPEKNEIKYDKELVKKKYEDEVDKILYIEKLSKKNNSNYRNIIDDIRKYKDGIRDKRAKSLKESGEFSTYNIVYKMLRRNGYFELLSKIESDIYDTSLTLECLKDKILYIEYPSYGDKFILNRNIALLHGNIKDRYKILENKNLDDKFVVRNLRIRKDYIIDKNSINEFTFKKYITKE